MCGESTSPSRAARATGRSSSAREGFLNDLFPELDGSRVLLIAHSANRWALQHLLLGAPLEEVVGAPFDWQEGWEYALAR